MQTNILLIIGIMVIAIVAIGLLWYAFVPRDNSLGMMKSSNYIDPNKIKNTRDRLKSDETGASYEKLKKDQRRARPKKKEPTLDEMFFMAGVFTEEEKRAYHRSLIIFPAIIVPVLCYLSYGSGPVMLISSLIFGYFGGRQLPKTLLERKIKKRGEEIVYFLPLVIEQIVIGVSSSLDIGPCLQKVVQMADERDTHNPVTELLRHAHHYVRSGVALEEALNEIGRLSYHVELKHAFMSLSQVCRHGGEVTRQLQELADAVAGQRETRIEAKIKKLELVATGPVALVFVGFMMILLIGFGLQLKTAF